jgi:hypothetical protein
LLRASSKVVFNVVYSSSRAKSFGITDEIVEVNEKSGGTDLERRCDAASSTSSETLAAVKALVVLAVKKTVSGVTFVLGKIA